MRKNKIGYWLAGVIGSIFLAGLGCISKFFFHEPITLVPVLAFVGSIWIAAAIFFPVQKIANKPIRYAASWIAYMVMTLGMGLSLKGKVDWPYALFFATYLTALQWYRMDYKNWAKPPKASFEL